LKDLQAYSGQKLPVLDGFVARADNLLDRYERGFYQFSIELVPGDAGTPSFASPQKITAWYADRDVAKSGYQVLPSNGRLELDFLDRLEEKLTGKPVASASPASNAPQAPQPKLDLSGARAAAAMATPLPQSAQQPDEVAALRNQRIAGEKRVQQSPLNSRIFRRSSEARRIRQICLWSRNPALPFTPGRESSRILFEASANDEFEFLDGEGEWIHISISGDSRDMYEKNSVELPEGSLPDCSPPRPAPKKSSPVSASSVKKPPIFPVIGHSSRVKK